MRLLEDDDRERQLSALSVPLADANRAWRELGLPEIDNKDRHERQFATWLQRNRPTLAARIRDAYADVHRSGRSLSGYVKLRDLSPLVPDPAWHTTRWNLADELLQAHADAWLARRLPAPSSTSRPLRPLAEVREASNMAVHKQVPRLRRLIEEWQRLHSASRSAVLPPAQGVLRELDDDGLLDFEVLSAKALIAWLRTRGYWPEDMPLSDRRADLGLTATRSSEPTGDGKVTGRGRPGGSAPGPHVMLNGKPVSARSTIWRLSPAIWPPTCRSSGPPRPRLLRRSRPGFRSHAVRPRPVRGRTAVRTRPP